MAEEIQRSLHPLPSEKITVLIFIYIFKIALICFFFYSPGTPLLQRLLIAEGADYSHERSGKIPALIGRICICGDGDNRR